MYMRLANESIILLDYIFNSCFALTGIVRVRLILEGGLGEQFCLCRGCTGINIGEGVFFRLWGNKAILLGIWVDWTLAILFISFFCTTKGCTQKLLFFVYIIIRREGVNWI